MPLYECAVVIVSKANFPGKSGSKAYVIRRKNRKLIVFRKDKTKSRLYTKLSFKRLAKPQKRLAKKVLEDNYGKGWLIAKHPSRQSYVGCDTSGALYFGLRNLKAAAEILNEETQSYEPTSILD